ncbi:MAG: Dabb family protein [Acidimicrobiia bacterium]|jgi:hypothetical protein
MLRHVALFRFKPETTDERIEAAMAALSALPDQIDEIRKFRFGPDAGITEGAWDFAVVAVLDNADDYVEYRDHPAHVAVLQDYLAPLIAEAARVQFESEGDSVPHQGS